MSHVCIQFPKKHPRGIFALAHGLNNQATCLTDIRTKLQDLGFITLNLTLAGHENTSDWSQPSRHSWLENFNSLESSVADIRKNQPSLPAYFLGFSTGALVFMDHVLSTQSSTFSYAVMIAPAITLRKRSKLLKWPSRIFPGLSIKSLSPDGIRRHDHLPMSFYRALFESLDAVRDTLDSNEFPVKSLVACRPRDELVCYKSLNHLSKEKFSHMDFLRLRQTKASKFHHLAIDKKNLGSANWQKLFEEIEKGLEDHSMMELI
ncbi:MAG: alpha/beta hydrolase [Pseudobacteriovorax sp.]|nr:alpha/beta hydrolase [Pseudobacteriovorax sp.]